MTSQVVTSKAITSQSMTSPAMTRRLLGPDSFRTMPWANGRGMTVELCRADMADGNLLWRLSIATVAEDGPFSPLPGIGRSLTLLDGGGFDLEIEGAVIPARPFEPVSFSGDDKVLARNVRGPSRDFNVMWRRGRIGAEVAVLREGENAGASPLPAIAYAFLYAAADARLDDDSFLPKGTLLAIEGVSLSNPLPRLLSGGPAIRVLLNGADVR